jgi:SMC interacting uncharacterized protein involved in chromosome segregation
MQLTQVETQQEQQLQLVSQLEAEKASLQERIDTLMSEVVESDRVQAEATASLESAHRLHQAVIEEVTSEHTEALQLAKNEHIVAIEAERQKLLHLKKGVGQLKVLVHTLQTSVECEGDRREEAERKLEKVSSAYAEAVADKVPACALLP